MNKNQNKLFYEPGDHLAIVPVNRTELVDKVLAAVVDVSNPDEYLLVEDLIERKKNNS